GQIQTVEVCEDLKLGHNPQGLGVPLEKKEVIHQIVPVVEQLAQSAFRDVLLEPLLDRIFPRMAERWFTQIMKQAARRRNRLDLPVLPILDVTGLQEELLADLLDQPTGD